MINYRELRVGNIIHEDIGVYTVQPYIECVITAVSEKNFNNSFHWSRAFGIPVTDDWLLKFGYIGPDWRGTFDHKDLYFYVKKMDEGYELFTGGNFDTIQIATFKYVHTLQNLIYFTQGKELTYE